jgi:hypothetical protein
MPQFFLAVGFAYRMTFLRRLEKDGTFAAYWHAVKRILGLLLVAFVVHTLGRGVATWAELNSVEGWNALATGLKRDYFQTLTHIAVTSLWVLPVIAARPGTRVLYMLGSAALFQVLSEAWYYRWVNTSPNGIDGGPLGFLTWTIPLLVGTLAYDAMRVAPGHPRKLLAWSAGLMLVALCTGMPQPCDTPPQHLSLKAAAGRFVEPPFVFRRSRSTSGR